MTSCIPTILDWMQYIRVCGTQSIRQAPVTSSVIIIVNIFMCVVSMVYSANKNFTVSCTSHGSKSNFTKVPRTCDCRLHSECYLKHTHQLPNPPHWTHNLSSTKVTIFLAINKSRQDTWMQLYLSLQGKRKFVTMQP